MLIEFLHQSGSQCGIRKWNFHQHEGALGMIVAGIDVLQGDALQNCACSGLAESLEMQETSLYVPKVVAGFAARDIGNTP